MNRAQDRVSPALPSLAQADLHARCQGLRGRAGQQAAWLSPVTLRLLLSSCDPVPRRCPQALSSLASMAPAPSATSRRGST